MSPTSWLPIVFASSCSILQAAQALYDVRDYGAKADGQALCTQAIQKAIDECSNAGGAVVYLPPGRFLCGTIVLKTGVTVELDAGCTLVGTGDLAQYPPMIPAYRSYTDTYTDKSLIYAEKAERIAITGRGIIDGQGALFHGPYKVRPYVVRFVECKDVVVQGVTMRNSPMWVQHYLACDDVRIDGVVVRSHVNQNNDGIDIDSCRRVLITGCNIDSGDDAIVLKSTSARPCQDIVVTGCVLRSGCNAFKLGTESNGGFQNIVMNACSIHATRLAGVALEVVDGGTMDRVVVTGVTMTGVGAPIFVRLGNRARPFQEGMDKPGVGALRNVTISDVEATGADHVGCAIAGLPGANVEILTLSNIRLSFSGGGSLEEASRLVPENPDKYPEYAMFGKLPAYGCYCRHVRGLKMTDVQLQLAGEDKRHAVALEDVWNATVAGLDVPHSNGAASLVRLGDVQNAMIRGCTPPEGTGLFLLLRGAASKAVTLAANDFSGVRTVMQVGADVPKGTVAELANRTN